MFRPLRANDIFISYARRDGATYADGLADELTKRGFSCFTDRLGTDADALLPAALLAELKRCSMLVVLCTPAASASPFVAQEIDDFAREKKTTRAVIPVVFDRAAEELEWYHRLRGIAAEYEPLSALTTGDPSDAVVNRVQKSFMYARSKERLRRYTLGAIAVLGVTLIATAGVGRLAVQQLRNAQAAQADAARSTELAEAARKEAAAAAVATETARKDTARQQRFAAEAQQRGRLLTYASDMALARRKYDGGDFQAGRALLEQYQPDQKVTANPGADLRGFEWRYLWKLFNGSTRITTDPDLREVAVSPDGSLIAFSVARRLPGLKLSGLPYEKTRLDGSIRLVSVRTGRIVGVLNGHQDFVRSLAFSPDGRLLASGSFDNTIRLWDVATKSELAKLPGHTMHEERIPRWISALRKRVVQSLAFTADGLTLASGGNDGTVKLWDVTKRAEHEQLIIRNYFITASPDGVIAPLPAKALERDAVSIDHIAFAPDAKRLAVLSSSMVSLWNLESKTQQAIFAVADIGELHSLAISRDGRHLAAGGSGNTVYLWDLTTLKLVARFPGHTSYIYSVAFSDDGHTLLSASSDQTIKLWNLRADLRGPQYPIDTLKEGAATDQLAYRDGTIIVRAGTEVRRWKVPHESVIVDSRASGRVQLSPDGKTLAMNDSLGLEFWSVTAGQQTSEIDELTSTESKAIAFSPDGRTIARANSGWVTFWDVRTRKERGEVRNANGDSFHSLDEVVYAPDGSRLAMVDGDTIALWNVTTRRHVWAIKAHPALVISSIAFSPDGRLLASASNERTVKLWDTANGSLVSVLKGHGGFVEAVVFSPDGSRLVSGGADYTIRVWDIRDPSSPKTSAVVSGHTGAITHLAYSPSGSRIASASTDGSVKIWETSLFLEVLTLNGHRLTPQWVSFSADERTLYTGGAVPTVRIWRVD